MKHLRLKRVLADLVLCGSRSSRFMSSLATEVDVGTLFTPQHVQLRETLSKIIDKDINPNVDQWEKEEQWPAHKILKQLGNTGLLGVTKPTEYGGLGLDYTYAVAVGEQLGDINSGGVATSISVQTDMSTPALTRFGNDEVKREFLAPSITGDVVSCIGVSEPGGGSDVASIKTKATKEGGDYIINGSKMWITNGYQADWMCLLANTSDGSPHLNKSLICLPMKTEGVILAGKIDKLGWRCSDTAQIHFDNVRVPQKYLIGEEGMGFTYQMLQFQEERLMAAVISLRPMEKIIEQTIEYTRDRKIFGKSILDNQVVHFRLAELQTDLECFRSLVYRTVGKYVQGEDVTQLASMCKLKAGRLAREVTDSCLQYWGGMGFTNEVLVSRMYRDLRVGSIGGGADEVMLSIICKLMGTLPMARK